MALDPQIPLSAQTPQFAPGVERRAERQRQAPFDASDLATAGQQRELRGLQIEGARRDLNAPPDQQAKLRRAVLDTVALSDMFKQSANRSALAPQESAQILQEAGKLGVLLRDQLIDLGVPEASISQLDRIMGIGAINPRDGAEALDTLVIDQLGAGLGEELFRKVEGGQKDVRSGEFKAARGQPSETFDPAAVTAESPSSVREFAFSESLTPERLGRFMALQRANPTVDLGNRVVQLNQSDPSADPLVSLEKELTPAQEPANIAASEEATQTARLGAQRVFEAGGAQATLNVVQAQSDKMLAAIEAILEHPGTDAAVGFGAINPLTLGSRLPTTEANDARALIQQFRNVVFVESLNNIRAQSETGGAVGQVSDTEGLRLESMMGSLDRTQSDEQFREQLGIIKDQVVKMRKLSGDAFELEFGELNVGQEDAFTEEDEAERQRLRRELGIDQ